MASILYVDDEETISRVVRSWLSRHGHEVYIAADVASALAILESQRIDGVFLDVWLGNESGLAVHDWIRTHDPNLAYRTVLVSGETAASDAVDRAVRETGVSFMPKPFDLTDLARIVQGWF